MHINRYIHICTLLKQGRGGFLIRATASQDSVTLHRPARSAWIGLQSASTMDLCARGPNGDTLDPRWTPSTRAARGGRQNGLGGGLRWRIKPDGHLTRAALSRACVFPAKEQVGLQSYGCKSACLGQYMQYIHIQRRYEQHTKVYIQ